MDETLFLVIGALALGALAGLFADPGAPGPAASDGGGGDSFNDDAAAADSFGGSEDPGPVWSGASDAGVSDDAYTQLPSVTDTIMNLPATLFGTADLNAALTDANARAFMAMLAASEGTKGIGNDGYNVMFGKRIFTSYADHPRQFFSFTNTEGRVQYTSAAGRYQFIARTWDALRAKLGLPDFSPQSQDLACLELIRERGALGDVLAGNLAAAIDKCAPTWASLPGAGYPQPERKFSFLVAAYTDAGGTTA